jgi:hypothetical protein
VSYQQQKHTGRYAERPPSEFSTFNSILFSKRLRILENMARNLERNAMFSQVRSRLGCVPPESDHATP